MGINDSRDTYNFQSSVQSLYDFDDKYCSPKAVLIDGYVEG